MEDKSMFVKMENYEELYKIFNDMKLKFAEAKKLMGKLNNLRSEEATELQLWAKSVDEIETKMSYVESILNQSK